jgi:8-oxo-dGTP diphosphatase
MKSLWILSGRVAFWVAWPLLFVYLLRGERTRVIIRSNKEILAVKGWLGSGRWILPGGGLHVGEEAVTGAIREVREETGLRLEPAQLQYIGVFDAEKGLKFRYHLFAVELNTRPSLKAQQFEIIEIAWVPEDILRTSKATELTTREALQTWSPLDELVQ